MERPCIIIGKNENKFLVIKVTKHKPRQNDPYDVVIIKWYKCGLKQKSTARTSKVTFVDERQILNYKGALDPIDEQNISIKLQEYINRLK